MRAIPGVRAAAFAQRNPIGEGGSITTVEVLGYTPSGKRINVSQHVVSPGYFDTLRISVFGRAIGEQDTSTSPPAVVIDRAFATEYFHRDNPLGHEVQFGSQVQPRVITRGWLAMFRQPSHRGLQYRT